MGQIAVLYGYTPITQPSCDRICNDSQWLRSRSRYRTAESLEPAGSDRTLETGPSRDLECDGDRRSREEQEMPIAGASTGRTKTQTG
ncbi:hypothetical protein C488_17813 [Natrinema pellirubrum DSM 15624]|uniref:Uncharacterized protein n=1 Tax=Natrinema pellirubrum (strain DSM 15624 / CIP 106293 / JCM 10476 / NCIMB 786 / 157) TaxID=797303 RepID=L9YAQ3_NATP1|nr:hypothetical protein C488_17813 [Natrinema pellirubrum DSM 15624]